jgi:RNA polymerase sigma factor (sigma-70 family)
MNEVQTQIADSVLVRHAQAGSRAAFAELISRHRPLLLAVCRRFLADFEAAEDTAQDAIVRALLVVDTLRQPDRFGPWLVGIGLNMCRRRLHERRRATEAWSFEALVGGAQLQEPFDVDPQAAPELWAEERELAGAVRRAVHALPPGQRAAVLLAYLAGLSQAETAAALGVPVGAVKARLHKARAALRRSLWTLWSDQENVRMSSAITAAHDFVDVRVWDVRGRLKTPDQPARNIVLLEEVGGDRVLPIWVGAFEGDSIVIQLEKVDTMRPLTFSFAASVLTAAGGRLREVRVNRLTPDDGTFFAEAVVEGPAGVRVVDCRPSDGISLALAVNASIRVASAVMDAEAQPREAFTELPAGVLTAADGAQRIQENQVKAREEWTKSQQERARRRGNA